MWPVLAFAVMAVARWGASFTPIINLDKKGKHTFVKVDYTRH